MDNFSTNKNRALTISAIIGVFILFILIALTSLLSKKPVKNTQNVLSPTSITTPTAGQARLKNDFISSVTPSVDHLLTAGQPATFSLELKKSMQLNNLLINLTSIDITKDAGPVNEKVILDQSKVLTVTIKTTDPIKPKRRYILSIKNEPSESTLFVGNYRSVDVPPTPIPSNNPSLIQYLPHETESYRLLYFADQNLYISHFKYNPNISGTLDDQYQKAKNEARDFIKSKGIDPATLTIDFRRS